MNKKGQLSGIAGSSVFRWVFGTAAVVGLMYWLYKTNPTAKSFMIFIGSVIVFTTINVIFVYFWYWIGTWIYKIIKGAKYFVKSAVSWVLDIFE